MAIVLWACSNADDKVDEAFIKGLKEKQLEKSAYFISLPPDFTIQISEGPDFYVYYFYPADTTLKGSYSGGIYIGNYPSDFKPESDSCTTETVSGKILNQVRDWTIYICNGRFTVQTIVENKPNDGWDEKLHVFGYGSSKKEINKLLAIFSTLRKK